MGFLEILSLIFIVLKLLGHVDWSWGWVLLPLWGSFALYFLILLRIFVYKIIFNR